MRIIWYFTLLALSISSFADRTDQESLNNAITGFNEVVEKATAPLTSCNDGMIAPKDVSFEDGDDASKLHQKVDLGLKKEGFSSAEYFGDELSVLTIDQADKLFKVLSEVEYMKFDYLHSGCEIRAHEYSLIAKANGIEMGKAITMFGTDIDRGGLYPKEWTQKEKSGEAIPVPDGFVGWRYHVAPYVLVKDGDKIIPYVFDIGVANKPKTLKQWNTSLVKVDKKKTRTFVKDRGFLHPDDKSPREDGKSFIETELNRKKLIDEMGINEFEYWDEKGLLYY